MEHQADHLDDLHKKPQKTVHHAELAAGRWHQLSLMEQMANVGSEVERCLNWRAKHHESYAQLAFERSLELLDLTLSDARHKTRLKELARVREAWGDYVTGSNESGSTETSWKKYFMAFTYAARKNR